MFLIFLTQWLIILNFGTLKKTKKSSTKASTQKPKPKAGGLLNELLSGRENLKKTPVQTKNSKPAVNTNMEQLTLAMKKMRGKIAPSSGQQSAGQQSSEWSD